MNKKLVIILAIVLVVATLFVACSGKTDYDTEIIKNGNFESFDSESKVASNWTVQSGTTVVWNKNTNDGSSEYDSKLGKSYVSINTSSSAYNYIYQTVTLEKNATYKLEAYINLSSISGTAGIYFDGAIEPVGIVLTKTTEGWTEYEQYFTSTVSGEVKLILAVGTNNSNSTANISFDNVSLQKVDGVNEDVELAVLKMQEGYTMSDGGSITFVIVLTLISVGIFVAMYFAIKAVIKNKKGSVNNGTSKADKFLNAMTSSTAMFLYVLLACFVIRFIIVLATAEGNDLITSWVTMAKDIASKGFLSYYSSSTYEPQGIVWLLGIIGYIGKALDLQEVGYAILVRMPMVISDIAICYSVYSLASKYVGEKSAITYGFIYAIVPVFFILGSLYGSMQSIAMACLVAMAIAMLNKKYVATGVYYVLALFFSNYALILLPVILLYQIYAMFTDKTSITKTIVTMVASFVVFYLLSLPLCWSEVASGNILLVFKKMYGFFNVSYPTLSDNTFNLYAIFASGDKARSSNFFFEIGNWGLIIALSAYAIYHYIKSANRLDLILISAIMIIAYSAIGVQGALDIMPIGLVLLLLYIIITPDTRLYIGLGALASLSFLNIAQYLSQSGFISGVDNAGWLSFDSKSAFMIIFSILTVGVVFYLMYVSADITINSYVKPIAESQNEDAIEE